MNDAERDALAAKGKRLYAEWQRTGDPALEAQICEVIREIEADTVTLKAEAARFRAQTEQLEADARRKAEVEKRRAATKRRRDDRDKTEARLRAQLDRRPDDPVLRRKHMEAVAAIARDLPAMLDDLLKTGREKKDCERRIGELWRERN